jgi:Uma2 family endonuclease
MYRRMTLAKYLAGPETMRPQELAYGILREPPAPNLEHQVVVGRLHVAWHLHVRRNRLGRVFVSPADVVLDRDRHLVVQPDVSFVVADRLDICTDRIWGAPDLVAEVLSFGNARRDRTVKVGWYRKYGVRECWLVDTIARLVDVIDLTNNGSESRRFEDRQMVRSTVLPRLRLRAGALFAD